MTTTTSTAPANPAPAKPATAKPAAQSTLATLLSDAQTRAARAASQLAELGKANAGAMLEAGTALTEGLKQTGEATLAESLRTLSLLSEDLKALAAVRTSDDALKLQGKLVQRNVDLTLKFVTANTQALRDIAKNALTPLSGCARANLAALRTVA